MKINQKAVQIISDAAIPLMGFFLWNWSLYFILLFYFIDLFGNEMVAHLKSRKTIQFQQKPKTSWVKFGTYSAVLFIILILLIHFSMIFISPNINFWNEIVNFWNYEEMGIKQGYILVPLVLFVAFQQYKMTFLMPAKFRTTSVHEIWKKHLHAIYILIGFTGLVLGISLFVTLPEVVYVFGIVFFTTLYKWKFV